MIHPFQIFPTFLKLSSLCPKSQQNINKIKVSWYEPTMSPNSSKVSWYEPKDASFLCDRGVPPLSKATLSISLRPHYLLTPRSLAPPTNYSSNSFFLLTPSFLPGNMQFTSIFKNNSFSILGTPGDILPSLQLLLCQELSPLQCDFYAASRPFCTIPEATVASSIVLSFKLSKLAIAVSELEQQI